MSISTPCHLEIIIDYIQTGLKKGCIAGQFETSHLPKCCISLRSSAQRKNWQIQSYARPFFSKRPYIEFKYSKRIIHCSIWFYWHRSSDSRIRPSLLNVENRHWGSIAGHPNSSIWLSPSVKFYMGRQILFW